MFIFLMTLVLWVAIMSYFLPFMGAIWAFLNVTGSLLKGHYYRAAFWFACFSWCFAFLMREDGDGIDLSLEKFMQFTGSLMLVVACISGLVWLIKYNGGVRGMFLGSEDSRPWSPGRRRGSRATVEHYREYSGPRSVKLIERGDGVMVPSKGEW